MPPATTEHETESRHVETFAVLDLDRTLFNTDAFIDIVCMMLTQHGISPEVALDTIARIKDQTGGSVPLFEDLGNTFAEDVLEAVREEILRLASEGELRDILLYDGSREILDMLDELEVPFGVLTYGKETEQQYKIDLFRLLVNREPARLPAMPTDERLKGNWIHGAWKQADGFIVPVDFTESAPVFAERIVILDDKPDNLLSPDPTVGGILIDNSNPGRNLTAVIDRLQHGETLVQLAS